MQNYLLLQHYSKKNYAEVQRNESLKQEINRNLGTAYFKLDDMEKAFKHHEDDCYGSMLVSM